MSDNDELDFDMIVHPSGIQCEHEGCESKDAFACYLDGDEPEEHLCGQHAVQAGYCCGCGHFYAGTSEFERNNGWCDNCHSEFDEPDDDDDEYHDHDPY